MFFFFSSRTNVGGGEGAGVHDCRLSVSVKSD